MRHNGLVVDRRRFLLAGAGLPGALRSRAAASDETVGLRLEYSASNPPAVPPPLELAPPARLVLEFAGTGDAARCTLALRTVRANEPCLLPVALWTADLAYYRHAREALYLPAYLGDVVGSDGLWSLAVSGRDAYSVRVLERSEEPVGSVTPLPWITYRHTLEAYWRQGPLGETPPELWMLRFPADPGTRQIRTEAISADGDPGRVLSRFGASRLVSATILGARKEPEPEFALAVKPERFEPFALRNYPGDSLGMAPLDTTYLQPEALEAYRSRHEFRLSGVLIAAVDAVVDRDAVAPLLPPPCRVRDTPVVRVVGVRGLAAPGLDEAWLLADCDCNGERVWYGLSHVRGTISGSEFGREVLGYPTVSGSVAATLGSNRFGVSVSRDGRPLADCGGFYGGFSTGTSLANMRVATLRLRHRPGQPLPTGEIVVQPWYYQGLRKPVSRDSLHASFATGRDRPWNQLGPARAYRAIVFDSATLQRLPGAVLAEVADVGPYFRDRCEGRLPWETWTGPGEIASD